MLLFVLLARLHQFKLFVIFELNEKVHASLIYLAIMLSHRDTRMACAGMDGGYDEGCEVSYGAAVNHGLIK